MCDAVNACNYAALCALADLVGVTASDLMGYWVEQSNETRAAKREVYGSGRLERGSRKVTP